MATADEMLSGVQTPATADEMLKAVKPPESSPLSPDDMLKSVQAPSEVAQPVEQRPVKAPVAGSTPALGATPNARAVPVAPGETEPPPVPPRHDLGWVGKQTADFALSVPRAVVEGYRGMFESLKPGALAKQRSDYVSRLGLSQEEYNQLSTEQKIELAKQDNWNELKRHASLVKSGQANPVLAGLLGGRPAAEAVARGDIGPVMEAPGEFAANLLLNVLQLNQIRAGAVAGTYAGLRKGLSKVPETSPFYVGPEMRSTEITAYRPAASGLAGEPRELSQEAFPWGEKTTSTEAVGTQFRKTEPIGVQEPPQLAPLSDAQRDYEWLSAELKRSRAEGDVSRVTALSKLARDTKEKISGLKEQLGPLAKEYEAAKAIWNRMFGAGEAAEQARVPGTTETPEMTQATRNRQLSKVRSDALEALQSGPAGIPAMEGKSLNEFLQANPEGVASLSKEMQSGDLYRQLNEAQIWGKSETQKALDLELGVRDPRPLSQMEMTFLREPGVSGARIIKDVLVVDEALRHGPGAFGSPETVRVVLPKTWAEQVLKSGLPGYRLTAELRAQAYEFETMTGRVWPEKITREAQMLREKFGPESWAYDYFTDAKMRAVVDDTFHATQGPHLLRELYSQVQRDSEALRRIGLVDESPTFMANYLTQSHMKLFEVPGWRPSQSVIDRFTNNIVAASQLEGRPLTQPAAIAIAEQLLANKPTQFSYGKGRVFQAPGGQNIGPLLSRKEIPDWVRDMYGPLPPGPIGYGFTRMEQTRLLLFDKTAQWLENYELPTAQGAAKAVLPDTPGMGPIPGYTRLPDSPKAWGRLAGRQVQDDIVPVLKLMTETTQRAVTQQLLDISKKMWVVMNIPSWIRYALGNLAFVTLGNGLPNPLRPGEMTAAARAMRDVASWGMTKRLPPGMQALHEMGAFAGLPVGESGEFGFTRTDAFRRYVKDNYADILRTPDEQLPQTTYERVVTGLLPRPAAEMMEKTRSGLNISAQQGFLMSHMYARVLNAYVLQARGMTPQQAMLEITKWHPFYKIPSPIGSALKGVVPGEPIIPGLSDRAGARVNRAMAEIGGAIGTPVPSFNMETIRIYEQAMHERPGHLAAIYSLPLLFNIATTSMYTGSPTGIMDVENSLPDKDFANAKQRVHLLWPSRKNGLNYIDLDHVMPGGDMLSNPLNAMFSGPLLQEILAIKNNIDPDTGRPLAKPGQSMIEALSEREAQRFLSPPMVGNLMRDVPLTQEYGTMRRMGAEYEQTPTGAAAQDIFGMIVGGIPLESLQQAKSLKDLHEVHDLIRELRSGARSHSQTETQKEQRRGEIQRELSKPR